MPAKLFEALAAGVPSVAAIRGEAEAVLNETGAGVPVPIGDPEAMIQALQALNGDPQRRKEMGRAGRAYAEQHLSLQVAKQVLLDLCAQVVAGKPGSIPS